MQALFLIRFRNKNMPINKTFFVITTTCKTITRLTSRKTLKILETMRLHAGRREEANDSRKIVLQTEFVFVK